MNENIIELINAIETSYKKNPLEGILEAQDYFEDTNLSEAYQEFKDKTKYLLTRLKTIANKRELFEAVDIFDELLDSCK